MIRTRVKFCGITRAEDARLAASLGVDAVGVVLVPESPRALRIEAGAAIRAALPPFVAFVALFRDPTPAFVERAIEALDPTLLQFHGSEDGSFCAAFGVPYLKAIPAADGIDWLHWRREHPQALGFVADSHRPGGLGGSGQAFDWSRIPPPHPAPLVLAGGLNCENVGAAIRAVRPYAVDVASGIERAPGIKCPERMKAFLSEVRRVDASLGA